MTEPDSVVFIVDDDTVLRESLKDLICSVGLRVETFASGHEFLRSKRPEAPACLVLDVRLKEDRSRFPGRTGQDGGHARPPCPKEAAFTKV